MASLPLGPAKNDAQAILKKLQYCQFLFTGHKENYGIMALMEKEIDFGRLEKQFAVPGVFQTAVAA